MFGTFNEAHEQRNKDIVTRCIEGATFADVARAYGMSASRVRFIFWSVMGSFDEREDREAMKRIREESDEAKRWLEDNYKRIMYR